MRSGLKRLTCRQISEPIETTSTCNQDGLTCQSLCPDAIRQDEFPDVPKGP